MYNEDCFASCSRLGLNVVFSNIAIFSVHAEEGNDEIYISGTSVQVWRTWLALNASGWQLVMLETSPSMYDRNGFRQ
jgi:hypothetical protein